jgi:hypothetical protein
MSAFTSDNGHPRELKAATEALGIAIHDHLLMGPRAREYFGMWQTT